MPLTPGVRLGAYEIVTLLGAGGMGEVYRAHDAKLNRDVALKVLPEVFVSDPDRVARFQPDGRWLAYVSNGSDRDEVYVQPFPGPGTVITVSTSGGSSPVWNPQGRELFYVEPRPGEEQDRRMMAVNMMTPPEPGRPAPLFSFTSASLILATCSPTNCYSIAANGQEFFTLRMLPRQPRPVTQVRVILNWFEELKGLVPMN